MELRSPLVVWSVCWGKILGVEWKNLAINVLRVQLACVIRTYLKVSNWNFGCDMKDWKNEKSPSFVEARLPR